MTRSHDPQRRSALYPAIAEAATRAGVGSVAVIDVTTAQSDDLCRRQVTISYDGGQVLLVPNALPEGPASLDLACALKSSEALPLAVPAIASYAAVGARDLEAALVDVCRGAPSDAYLVVTTTWTLSSLVPKRRLRLVPTLSKAARTRPLAWVSIEGVGVAPSIPTLGDRPASGHSIIGLASFTSASVAVTAIGRVWSGGRYMSWFPTSVPAHMDRIEDFSR